MDPASLYAPSPESTPPSRASVPVSSVATIPHQNLANAYGAKFGRTATITPPNSDNSLSGYVGEFVRRSPPLVGEDQITDASGAQSLFETSPRSSESESSQATISPKPSKVQSGLAISSILNPAPDSPPKSSVGETTSLSASEKPSVVKEQTAKFRKPLPLSLSWDEIDMILDYMGAKGDFSPKQITEDGDGELKLPYDKSSKGDWLIVPSPAELIRRLQHYLSFHIPGVKRYAYGRETAHVQHRQLLANAHTWFFVRRMACYGVLEQCTSGTQEACMFIRNHWFSGRPHLWDDWTDPLPSQPSPPTPTRGKPRKPIQNSPKPKTALEFERPQTRRVAQSVEGPTQHAPERKIKLIVEAKKESAAPPKKTKSTSPPAKRKRTDEETQTAKEKKMRHTFDPNESKVSAASELFARHVKSMLNSRSIAKTDYGSFMDAILPDNAAHLDLEVHTPEKEFPGTKLEDYGDPSGLHEAEIALCKTLSLTYDLYRCQKSRFFIALAVFIEYNHRSLANNPGFKIWNVGPSQCQLFSNMDVNKASEMYRAFLRWGWTEPMWTDKKKSILSPKYLEQFPQEYRQKLMGEVGQWEADNVRDTSQQLAMLL